MTDFNEILEQHHKMMADIEQQKKDMAEKIRSGLDGAFKQFFELVPEAKSIAWTQYTPYFADGDECVFRVNDYELHESEDPDYEYGDGGIRLNRPGEYYYESAKKEPNGWAAQSIKQYEDTVVNFGGIERVNEIKKAMQLLDSIFSLGDDFFKDTFGNHVKVVMTKDGTDIQDYDHD